MHSPQTNRIEEIFIGELIFGDPSLGALQKP